MVIGQVFRRGLVAVAILAGGAASASAEHLRIEIKVFGMDCATCAHGLTVAMKKLEGVETVDISLNKSAAELTLREGNRVTIDQLRTIIKRNGFTPKEAVVTTIGVPARKTGGARPRGPRPAVGPGHRPWRHRPGRPQDSHRGCGGHRGAACRHGDDLAEGRRRGTDRRRQRLAEAVASAATDAADGTGRRECSRVSQHCIRQPARERAYITCAAESVIDCCDTPCTTPQDPDRAHPLADRRRPARRSRERAADDAAHVPDPRLPTTC